MSAGDLLVRVALLASLLAIAATLRLLQRGGATSVPGGEGAWRWAAWSGRAAAAASVVAFLWLLGRFVLADVSIAYVHLYTHVGLPLRWRIAGTWTGREGSLLLWATLACLVSAAMSRAVARRSADPKGQHAWTGTLLGLYMLQVPLLAGLLWQGSWGASMGDIFGATPGWLLDARPDGSGLNPTLRSGFILIHPPLMFLAYALSAVPAAAGLWYLWCGRGSWSSVSLAWGRTGWMVYTFAMGLGAMWAYVTLNFGGYWAWDPVEVANLLPWLALSMWLHLQVRNHRTGKLPVAGAFLGTLPLVLTIFSTFSTRSGLWVSVHAFTDPSNTFRPDPGDRLLDILDTDATLAPFVGFTLALTAVALLLLARRLWLDHGTFGRAAQVFIVLAAAFAGMALLAPTTTVAWILEAAYVITGGHIGFGLLALATLALLWACLPALFAPETQDDAAPAWRRLDFGTLAIVGASVLGSGLLVLWLFHIAAVRGWSEAFYEERLPWIAAPVLLGLLLLQARGHGSPRRAASWTVGLGAAAVLAAGLVTVVRPPYWNAGPAATAYLFLAVALVVMACRQVYHAATHGPAKARHGLLVLAGVLNVLFWIDPPTHIGWGAARMTTGFPVQLWLGLASLAALYGALRIAAGAAPRHRGLVYLAIAVLGGFGITPVLALVAWTGRQPPHRLDRAHRARIRHATVYAIHLCVGLLLLGYGTTTYLGDEVATTAAVGTGTDLGGHSITWTRLEATGPNLVDQVTLGAAVNGRPMPDATLDWEPSIGAHLPMPAIHRSWNGDLYTAVDQVRLAGPGCLGSAAVTAYEAGSRICTDDPLAEAEVRVVWLPGIGLLWGGLVLLSAAMALLMAMGRQVPRR